MLSNKPSLNSITSNDRSEFSARNADVLRKLMAFINISEGLTIGFVDSPGFTETNLLLDFLDQELAAAVDFVRVDAAAPDLHFLLDTIIACLASSSEINNDPHPLTPSPKKGEGEPEYQAQSPAPSPCLGEGWGEGQPLHSQTSIKFDDQPKVVVVSGLEKSIGVLGDYPPVLVDLNFARDAYRKLVPYPLLLILPSYAITRIAHFVPDFWAWKSAEFPISPTHSLPAANNLENIIKIIPPTKQSIPVKQERFDLLNQLLNEEYAEPSLTRADLFLQRGKAYFSHAQYSLTEAEIYYWLGKRNFISFIQSAIATNRTNELSNHPFTQELLAKETQQQI
jgi:hypothetical protein